MKLSEIRLSNPPTTILITSQFAKDYKEFASQSPDVVPQKLRDFCKIKMNNELISGDDMFTGPPLTGYRHYQVITGKCILIYRQVGSGLRLFELVEHNDYEGKRQHSLAQRLGAYSKKADAELITINPDEFFSLEKPKPELDDNVFEEIKNSIITVIVSGGLSMIKLALEKNDWSELMDWIASDVPGVDPETIFAAFNGVRGLTEFIESTIKDYGFSQEYMNT